jgi:acyl carrier protein
VPDEGVINEKVRDFILSEFLPGEDPDELKEDTPLITSGILDSIATLKLITYLEKEFDITVAAHEADSENLNTISDICRLVVSKLR